MLICPPDEGVKIKNISAEFHDTGGILFPDVNFSWQFGAEGIYTPSGRNGEIVNDSIHASEIDFYFR